MSLNELTEYYPQQLQLRRRNLKRQMLKSSTRLQKTLKTAVRRGRSKTITFARSQYYPATAYGDLRQAARRNEDIFVTSLILLVVLMFAATTTALQFLLTFMGTATAIADLTNFNGGLLLLITFAVPGVLCAWVAAFLVNMFSISLMDGMSRKVKRSVRLTARQSLRTASRTANAWLLFVAMLLSGPVTLLVGTTLYMQIADMYPSSAMAVMPYMIGACAVWVLYVLAQYSLVPSVALFETDLSLGQVLGRSRQLVKRRGRIFSLTAYGLAAVGITATYFASAALQAVFHIDKAALFSVGSLVAVLGAHGLIVMLYRKRKLARKN